MSLDDLRASLARIVAAERREPLIDPDNGTRWWLHPERTDRAVVLLHGFTNNPRQYARLGPYLHAAGYNVIAPRFPFHGFRDRLSTAIARLTIDDLPFFGIKTVPGDANDTLGSALAALPNAFVWWDPIHKAQQLPAHGYPRFSTRALGHTIQLAAQADRAALQRPTGGRIVGLLNARDPIVNNALARRRLDALHERGLTVQIDVRSDLPAQHDVIEPTLPNAPIAISYPWILAALNNPNR